MNAYLISYFYTSPFSIRIILIYNAPSQSDAIEFFYRQYPGTDMIAISEIEDPNICIVDDSIDYLEEQKPYFIGESGMYTKEFNIAGHRAKTLDPGYLGEHNGWVVTGEIHEDYYEWVNDFEAHKIGTDEFVKGNFETEVVASSKKAYDEFVKLFPPSDWDYWDI